MSWAVHLFQHAVLCALLQGNSLYPCYMYRIFTPVHGQLGSYLRYTADVWKLCACPRVPCLWSCCIFVFSPKTPAFFLISQFTPGPGRREQHGHSWRGGGWHCHQVWACLLISHTSEDTWYVWDFKQNKQNNPERTFCSYMSKLNLLNGRKAICRSSNLHCIFIYHSHYT